MAIVRGEPATQKVMGDCPSCGRFSWLPLDKQWPCAFCRPNPPDLYVYPPGERPYPIAADIPAPHPAAPAVSQSLIDDLRRRAREYKEQR